MLPSTEDLISTRSAQELLREVGRKRLTSLARSAIDSIRSDLSNGSSAAGIPNTSSKQSLLDEAERRLKFLWADYRSLRLRKVINATGVVIHTNLGRAPLSDAAVRAIQEAAGYCTVEYDISSGKRGRRGFHVESLISEITGAESALIVNNCAAAAYLVLTVLAAGGEVIVSRGELVEIGGDFRIPDVLAQSGASLKEIGTTNRTKLSDYERAIGMNTKVILRVHPSNYKIIGFTEKPELDDLASLSRRHDMILYEDAGSGALLDLSEYGLDEPQINESIAAGADVVTFSGDKLVGGAQAGIIVGRTELVERMRKHPLYRALRASKLIYAALEASLDPYLRDVAINEVPALRMLAMTKEEIGARARNLAKRLQNVLGHDRCEVEIVEGGSVIGGGAASGVQRETELLALRHPDMSVTAVEERLRQAQTPVIARIESERVLIDLRTVSEEEEAELYRILADVLR